MSSHDPELSRAHANPSAFSPEPGLTRRILANNSKLMLVSEFNNILLYNNDLEEFMGNKLYWRFHHDGLVAEGDPDIESIYFQEVGADLPHGSP